ncbi:UDP-N-acetylglucosamine-N-acetylmuramylpentapeptide N-acetylglucosamine transferase [Gracilimonas mengyeensis]|uniref:UDP-N-acetylglucosamine--N-acetylmuramyl-(pentapeptide) pyrophosphoryl-undecaprenol N-acetylglucosamine transferase n=1 Tax=Gracilimonas mengyeensis TaxID=1302730 RepID=A0A521E2Y9_9BACT|nr:UDP-N-acetylglucosamine-N-acetylmuramylpentapeptide N-acetylglucosamine transferase [Gracilimonas mengyeensis]
MAAGGTGGHVYPAISIADALKEQNPETEILFVGTRDHMEWRAVPKAGYDIESIWISGFHRRFTLKNLVFPFKLVTSLAQSLKILADFRPQVVVSCGGYAAGPIGWTAGKKGIPVVIQEQNSFPGVTNRLLAKFATKIFTAFKEADRYLPASKTQVTGNPTRATLTGVDKSVALSAFGFDDDKPVLLVMGGSGGAKTINEAMKANMKRLHDEAGLQIIWQCGSRYYDQLKNEFNAHDYKNLRLTAFLDNMAEAYAAADLVMSRAGASSCSELMLTGKPSVLVPSPNVAGDHQTQNAKAMADAGASKILDDSTMKETMSDLVEELIYNQEHLKSMNQAALELAKPEAAQLIAKEILEIATSKLDQ